MKPGVFSQVYLHFVFSPLHHQSLLLEEYQTEIFSYISGIITNRKNKSIIINGMPDHIHILIGWNPSDHVPDLVACIKRESSKFINSKNWFRGKYYWQEGYGVFSYSRSQINRIYKYIADQKEHHKMRSFKDEYTGLLKKYEITYDEKYLFNFFE